jgi:hypothetical protein
MDEVKIDYLDEEKKIDAGVDEQEAGGVEASPVEEGEAKPE